MRLSWLGLVITLSAPAETLVLTRATVWVSPAGEPVRNANVVIENGLIASVGRVRPRAPRQARVLDCRGLTILAGFWNSHVHFFERKWENAAAIPARELERQIESMTTRYGFASVFDIGSTGTNTRIIRERIQRGEVRGPAIRTTGEVIVAPGAVPAPNILRMLGNMVSANYEVTTAAQAEAAARKALQAGSDGIKIHLQRPIGEDAIRAAAGQAGHAGKPVFLHPASRADVLAAARSGVDILAHTTPFSAWDDSVVRLLLEKRMAITPTLSLWRYALRHDRVSVQEDAVNTAVSQLKAWLGAGGTVFFGNDLGAVEYDPAEEYELMARAGMTFRQILTSLTTAPAERFGDSRRNGTIAPGSAADVVVVDGDPSTNIRALAAVRYTIRNGQITYERAAR